MTKNILYLLLATCLSQCTPIKKAPTGLEYEIIERQGGEHLKKGDIVQIHFSCETEYDSIIASSIAVKKPLILQIGGDAAENQINAALSELSVGDSAIVYPNAEKFLTQTMKLRNLPTRINPDSRLKFRLRIMKSLSVEELEDMKKKEDKLMAEKEKMLIEEYVQKEQITESPSSTGLYYIETKKGTGKNITEKSKLKLSYKGYFINGMNFGTGNENGDQIEVDLSEHKVILGWEEGLLKMSKGTKAKLIIPSGLAYGSKGMSQQVPPFSTLIFEIEVIDVK